ncbi:MAG: magnesium-translocating P-type ATPase [Alphaproteobacteria bacterium]|nr:magnesium-translocating P-type ATPase [Alphaproteobacteria bacterium]
MTPVDATAEFWTTREDELMRRLATHAEGLTTAEVRRRIGRFGPNLAVTRARRGIAARLGRRLAEPLIAILLIAAAISGLTGDWRSFTVILVIVVVSITLDITQEHRAERMVDALRRAVAVTVSVRRDGETVERPVADIVPGDVVELHAGELVPADGVMIAGHGAMANQALLTGEPYPVEKRPGLPASTALAEATNALFGGTSIVGGNATMVVVATGGATRFGAIAEAVQAQETPTAFESGVHALGMLILRLTGFLVLVVLLTHVIGRGLTLESFLFAVALAVGLTPELLPMVMTVTLARGAVRMAARRVVVKRLSAIEDLGGMDVLCTDKTGTLTEARIAHVASFGADGVEAPRVTELARRNSRFAGGLRSNLDDALLAGAPTAAAGGWRRVADIPFDFERRRAAVLVAREGEFELVVKGAPESVLGLCTRIERADGTLAPLDAGKRAAIEALLDAKGREGLRLLAVARRAVPADATRIGVDDETDLAFVGCAAFLDPPKESAGDAVARLARAGVRVKIVSGDAAPVVAHLVATLGLPGRSIASGDRIAEMTDAALEACVETTDHFVRVSPDQKRRIVLALRRRGHTVGFAGDGINDAPAIHAADVGLSVEGGTDIAREAADIILLAPDLGLLADGVAEGRRTFANIMKYVRMGTSSNFGNMLSMAVASLVLPFLPLAPLQILLNNLLYDISEIGIPFDAADPQDQAAPQRWDMGAVLRFTLVMGTLSSLFDIATFAVLILGFEADVATFRTAWFVESILTQILVIFVIRTAGRPWASRPHPMLVATSLGGLTAALAFALTPLGGVFGFVAMDPAILAAILGIAALYLVLADVLKRRALRRPLGR